jgi:hypothetical protein
MPFDKTLFNTSVDSDKFETLQTSSSPVQSAPLETSRVLIVALGADIFVDIGEQPDVDASPSAVPAGHPIMFGVHNPGVDSVSIKSVSGAGWVTLYHV